MIEHFIPRASTNIAMATYDSDAHVLTVEFVQGQSYSYSGVPQSVFLGLQNASSPGSYFYRQIRERYPYEEIA